MEHDGVPALRTPEEISQKDVPLIVYAFRNSFLWSPCCFPLNLGCLAFLMDYIMTGNHFRRQRIWKNENHSQSA